MLKYALPIALIYTLFGCTFANAECYRVLHDSCRFTKTGLCFHIQNICHKKISFSYCVINNRDANCSCESGGCGTSLISYGQDENIGDPRGAIRIKIGIEAGDDHSKPSKTQAPDKESQSSCSTEACVAGCSSYKPGFQQTLCSKSCNDQSDACQNGGPKPTTPDYADSTLMRMERESQEAAHPSQPAQPQQTEGSYPNPKTCLTGQQC
jgi:hypothetical protein